MGPGIATRQCTGAQCTIASCSSGYRLCSGACAACPSGGGIAATGCGTGGTCVATGCAPGYRLSGGACTAWQVETIVPTGVLGSNGGSVGIAFDPQGSPNFVYYELSGMLSLKHAFRRGGAWQTEMIEPVALQFQNDAALSFAINAAGEFYCGYYTDGDARLGFNTRGIWEHVTADFGAGEAIEGNIAVATDRMGHPGFAFANNGHSPSRVDYTFYPLGTRAVESGFSVANAAGQLSGTALAYDTGNAAHVVFYDHSALKHGVQNNGGNFSTEVIDSTAESGYNPSLAIDSQNRLHVSYHSRAGALLYSRKDPVGHWSSPTIVDSSSDPFVFGSDCKIAIGPNGPVIGYHDGSSNGSLKYASWNGSGWTLGVVDARGGVGFYSALAFDGSGGLHFAYVEQVGASYALKYAH
jgi:hypothetical protein